MAAVSIMCRVAFQQWADPQLNNKAQNLANDAISEFVNALLLNDDQSIN